MNTFFTTLLIGVSLSMDAFSLSLIYGTQNISKKDKSILSLIVGSYHFFMPLLGLFFGSIIIKYLPIEIHTLVAIIFTIIGLEMIYSSLKNKNEPLLISIPGFLLFGLSVSIDSFTTGIGLEIINPNYFQVSTLFALTSGLFTYLGLSLGNKINKVFNKSSTIFGGTILILLAIYYLSL